MKKFCYLIVFSFLLFSCKKNTDTSDVTVSITNASNENFKSIEIMVLTQQFKFENLQPAETKTVVVKETYRYFYVRVTTASDEIILQPIDYVGEKLIKSGKLDINLDIKTINNRRTLDLQAK